MLASLRLTAPFVLAALTFVEALPAQATASKRPMAFLDMQNLRQVGAPAPSADGRWLLYTLSTPDWKEAKRQTDIFLVSTERGVASTRQLTFTKDRNETSPRWSRDGRLFAFLSNRDAAPASAGASASGSTGSAGNQLYIMRPDGGEAQKITEAKEGVSTFAFSRDGKWLAYRSGKVDDEQLYLLPVDGLDSAKATQLTKQTAGVGLWEWSPDSRRIVFITADTVDRDERLRLEKKFTVTVRNAEQPRSSLWSVDVGTKAVTRLTRDTTITVSAFSQSRDNRWIAIRAIADNRYKRNVTESSIYGDNFLIDLSSGVIERLTDNAEVAEGLPSFSPDSRLIAFNAPADLTRYTMGNTRVYLRRVDDRGGKFRMLGESYDGDADIEFWSADGRTIYFNDGVRATNAVLALDVDRNTVRNLSQLPASVSLTRDEASGTLLVTYADPTTPSTLYRIAQPEQVDTRASWTQLTDANPQVRTFALGAEEEITWTSADGRKASGVLVKPVGYTPGTRYPLIVAIHGGPAAADILGFNGGYGSQVYAGAGYVVLRPNYRGSTNYGEQFKTGIVGDYFRKGYEDIMTGVDYLIASGIVDSARMGVLGWSAGGHWSNWILTHTNRFKAISTGAGTMNWISMYAESDVQRNRQFYLGDKLPYDDFDAYWNQSPLKYIKNARTPTMIHVVHDDPRVPRPQSEELHMALKRLGVPTEFFVYPGNTHGIPDARNQLVKSTAEMAWMDYWVRGMGRKFGWRDVLKTLEDDKKESPTATTSDR